MCSKRTVGTGGCRCPPLRLECQCAAFIFNERQADTRCEGEREVARLVDREGSANCPTLDVATEHFDLRFRYAD